MAKQAPEIGPGKCLPRALAKETGDAEAARREYDHLAPFYDRRWRR
jgi:hypothetical protein